MFVFDPSKYKQTWIKQPKVEEIKQIDLFETKSDIKTKVKTGKEPVPSLKAVDESGKLVIDWDKAMVPPANLDMIKDTSYAIMDEGASTRRRELARRREWFNTDEQFIKYLLVIDALEIEIIAEFDDGDRKPVPFTWDLLVFAERDIEIQLYFRQRDMQTQRT